MCEWAGVNDAVCSHWSLWASNEWADVNKDCLLSSGFGSNWNDSYHSNTDEYIIDVNPVLYLVRV